MGLDLGGSEPWHDPAVEELDYALRPPSTSAGCRASGRSSSRPPAPTHWEDADAAASRPAGRSGDADLDAARGCSPTGSSSWLIRRTDGRRRVGRVRPPGRLRARPRRAGRGAGRHRSCSATRPGRSRVVGDVRRAALGRPTLAPRAAGLDVDRRRRRRARDHGDREVLETLLEFAVHDLGARGIGAMLVYRPDDDPTPAFELRLPTPPPLDITPPVGPGAPAPRARPDRRRRRVRRRRHPPRARRAPGAERRGRDRSSRASAACATRPGRRYSFDDPAATVIVVSEDGPVTVLRNGEVLGASGPTVSSGHV